MTPYSPLYFYIVRTHVMMSSCELQRTTHVLIMSTTRHCYPVLYVEPCLLDLVIHLMSVGIWQYQGTISVQITTPQYPITLFLIQPLLLFKYEEIVNITHIVYDYLSLSIREAHVVYCHCISGILRLLFTILFRNNRNDYKQLHILIFVCMFRVRPLVLQGPPPPRFW